MHDVSIGSSDPHQVQEETEGRGRSEEPRKLGWGGGRGRREGGVRKTEKVRSGAWEGGR